MDLMQMRRRMLMQIGGMSELWNKTVITAPSNITTAGDVYAWLTSNGVLPSFNIIFFLIRDNADDTTWQSDDFIETSWVKGQSSSIGLTRVRSPQQSTRYLQTRNPISNPTDAMNVYQGETFTVFYQ